MTSKHLDINDRNEQVPVPRRPSFVPQNPPLLLITFLSIAGQSAVPHFWSSILNIDHYYHPPSTLHAGRQFPVPRFWSPIYIIYLVRFISNNPHLHEHCRPSHTLHYHYISNIHTSFLPLQFVGNYSKTLKPPCSCVCVLSVCGLSHTCPY